MKGLAEPIAETRIQADPSRHAMYLELLKVYHACEAHALHGGPDPAPLAAAFKARYGSAPAT